MALARPIRETIERRLRKDVGFRWAVLEEGLQAILNGEVEVGKAVLRCYLRAVTSPSP